MIRYIPLIVLVTFCQLLAKAQDFTPNQNIPYSFQFYQKLNRQVYDPNSRMHSAIKGYYADDSLLRTKYRELMDLGMDIDSLNQRSWVRRKLTQEHLLSVTDKDYTFYADFLPDFQLGKEFNESKTTWKNTRVFQIGGTIGKHLLRFIY